MREPDFDSLAAYVEGAVRQPEFAVIRQRATRVNRRRALFSSIAALIIAMTATSIGYAAADGGPPEVDPMPAPTASPDPIGWPRINGVVATGSGNLYAIVQPCDNCATELHVSEDDGASWQARTVPPPPNGAANRSRFASLVSLGPDTLAWREDLVWTRLRDQSLSSQPGPGEQTTGPGEQTAGPGEQTAGPGEQTAGPRDEPTDGFWTSADGGRTWRQAVVDLPVAAVPAGGRAFSCDVLVDESPCRVYTADPGTGHFAPLATQPGGLLTQRGWSSTIDTPPGGHLWVPGLDPATNKPAVATSADGGRTWKTHVFAAGVPAKAGSDFTAGMYFPTISAGAGGVGYALLYRDESGRRDPYRTTDGGATWRPVPGGPLPEGIDQQFVTADGAHVTRSGTQFRLARAGGGYRAEQLADFPRELLDSPHVLVPSQQAGGRHLVYTDTHVYLSGDGWTWKRADLP